MDKIQSVKIVGDFVDSASEVKYLLQQKIQAAGINIADKADVIIVVGGDGTYLHQMRELGFPSTPTIGVNAGSLGYFQEVEVNKIDQFVEDLKSGNYNIQQRPLVEVGNKDQDVFDLAVNEIVVKSDSGKAMQAEIRIGQGKFAHFIGDGLIISTPQGSTGYSAAAGGALLADSVDALQIVPSNPFDSTHYDSFRAPLIYSADVEIEIEPQDTDHRPLLISADGATVACRPNQTIIVRKSSKSLNVLRTNRFDYFSHLSHKLIKKKQGDYYENN